MGSTCPGNRELDIPYPPSPLSRCSVISVISQSQPHVLGVALGTIPRGQTGCEVQQPGAMSWLRAGAAPVGQDFGSSPAKPVFLLFAPGE